ncbi:MAG: Tad domain-containing protein [Nitrospirae bacterium]|nr:Tad domain-containing protein [Nitrospirota bacterium]
MECGNQKGSIFIFSLFTILVLTGFLAIVANGGYLITNKIQIQNAVDSAAYSGAVVQARGLNTLSALNQTLANVDSVYQKALFAWTSAVLADEGEPEGPAQTFWRSIYEKPLRAICSPEYLRKIYCIESRIVSRFNDRVRSEKCHSGNLSSDHRSVVAGESESMGIANLGPLEVQNLPFADFSAWSMNFDQGSKKPGLSVEINSESAKHLTGAGANEVSIGIVCDIPARWGLKPDFNKSQYVLSSATTPEKQGLYFSYYFGSGNKSYAIAKAKPFRKNMTSLELLTSDWNARLVPINASREDEETFQRFRRSTEGKELGFQQVPTGPLLH